MSGSFTAAGAKPRVSAPPFSYGLEIPDQFDSLVLHSDLWRKDLDRLLRSSGVWSELDASERSTLKGFCRYLIQGALDIGVTFVGLHAAMLPTGATDVTSLTISWLYTPGQLAHPEMGHAMAAGAESVEEVERGEHTLVVATSRDLIPDFGTSFKSVSPYAFSTQVFVPLKKTSWTAILTLTTSNPDTAETVRRVGVAVGASLTVHSSPTVFDSKKFSGTSA